MKNVSSITQKTRLKIWRAVRRRMKVAMVEENKSLGLSKETGLCSALRGELYKVSEYYKNKVMPIPSIFPELMEFKPAYCASERSYWWSIYGEKSYEERVKVCNVIIRRLEYKK